MIILVGLRLIEIKRKLESGGAARSLPLPVLKCVIPTTMIPLVDWFACIPGPHSMRMADLFNIIMNDGSLHFGRLAADRPLV